jgi:hypothetical protein
MQVMRVIEQSRMAQQKGKAEFVIVIAQTPNLEYVITSCHKRARDLPQSEYFCVPQRVHKHLKFRQHHWLFDSMGPPHTLRKTFKISNWINRTTEKVSAAVMISCRRRSDKLREYDDRL